MLTENNPHQNAFRMRHRDVFRFYDLPRISSEATDWDNLSDMEQPGVDSFEACRKNCGRQPDCMQFSFSQQSCKTSKGVMLGHQVSETTGERIKSGWIIERMEEYTERMDATCGNRDWILP